jgi:hypothetical protein
MIVGCNGLALTIPDFGKDTGLKILLETESVAFAF